MAVVGIIQSLIEQFVANPEQLGLALPLIGLALYWRKLLGVAGLAQNAAARVVFAGAVLGLLLLTGIIPEVNVGVAAEYATDAWHVGMETWNEIVTEFTS